VVRVFKVNIYKGELMQIEVSKQINQLIASERKITKNKQLMSYYFQALIPMRQSIINSFSYCFIPSSNCPEH
jgi:hypothetical protein